jgi:hypothetical protein
MSHRTMRKGYVGTNTHSITKHSADRHQRLSKDTQVCQKESYKQYKLRLRIYALLPCHVHDHVECLSAAVDALAGCC